MAAELIRVDPAAVAAGSAQLETGVGDAAIDFIVHEDQLADAAPGWIGESAKALSEVMARWEIRHTQHKRRTGELAYHMATAGTAFTTNEEHSAQALSSICPR
ncbi:RNA 2'-phosphotransferase [Mycobacterium sp.]|uniref:WXG100 family type VII secretion target n=1 Tax=Mycobacterium sp. TaxID=1785 RepID=UPI00126F9A3F|nr:RNA 2'-phosphotransferase [Mycobacterium sp.]KAA8956414.1 MAG: RNA 2'-phosphotransferase [Mycobacterium sp.]